MPLDGPRLEVIADEWVGDCREVPMLFTTSMHDRLNFFVLNPPLLAITFPDNKRIEPLVHGGAWRLRFAHREKASKSSVVITSEAKQSSPPYLIRCASERHEEFTWKMGIASA